MKEKIEKLISEYSEMKINLLEILDEYRIREELLLKKMHEFAPTRFDTDDYENVRYEFDRISGSDSNVSGQISTLDDVIEALKELK